jgi:hypothetical protein
MARVFDWIAQNKEWLFSGIGVAILIGGWQLLKRWRNARRRGSSGAHAEPPSVEGWKGVDVQGRYFAWDGPELHSLPDRSPIPAPQIAIDAIRALGATPSFGSQNKLRDHLAQGSMQVYETDRATWRRELLYASDGSQILLVRETP